MSKRIAISNQMGGAGKTTTTLNIGGALNEKQRDVLLVDLDPQGTLTEAAGLGHLHSANGVNLDDLLMDIDKAAQAKDLIASHHEFDILPSHQAMVNIEARLSTVPNTEKRLDTVLNQIDAEYDYVLVDCPPALNAITNNALVAAPSVLIPSSDTRRSIRALEQLADQIQFIEKHFGEINRLALVVNNVQYPLDNDQEEMLEWFESHFEALGVYIIRNRVAIKRAWNNGVSIFQHNEDCDMKSVYEDIAESIIKRTAEAGVEQ